MTWTLSWFEDVIVGYGQPPEGLPATRVAILEQKWRHPSVEWASIAIGFIAISG
ncbi:MAG: hypothetical protein IPO11_21240 [Betaproteobacteria bacterium]|jgi:hypothetical protein|nr:hypothetical protein [Betaproteobacteria bacterium]